MSFSSVLASGHHPDSAREVICSARLFALGKGNKQIRPIAVGDVLRRLTGKLLLQKYGDMASDLLTPQQLGIAVSGGMEGLIAGTGTGTARSAEHTGPLGV